ncbi:MAG: BON domain-containing protein [Flavisolibacter sp.]
MKQSNAKLLLMGAILSIGMQFTSCKSKPKDSDIQTSINDKLSASGVSATVADGVATLNGQCPDEACRTSAEQTAKDVKGVKSVVNNITVMPVNTTPDISSDATLETGVRDATKDYPGVTATVANGEVTLTGTIERDKLPKLMQAIQGLSPKKVNNNLTIK